MDNNNETPKEVFRNLFLMADLSGTGWWRRIAPITLYNQYARMDQVLNTYTMTPILDPRYYATVNSVTIQRWCTDQQREIVEKFFLPLFRQTGTRLIYEIDDAMHYEDIPQFNQGRSAFADDKIQDNIKFILNACDMVTVTTDYLKNYYNKRYGVPLNRIVAVPNMLPAIWYGDRYRPQEKVQQFNQYKAKPRIGVIGSVSHYNISKLEDKDGNLILDDISPISNMVRETVDDFQWVFFGCVPPHLADLAENGKIECHGCSPILLYPSALEQLQLQAVVAPLLDNEFNRSKSNIKYLECSAMGIPLYAQNMLPYSLSVPQDQLFKDGDELKDKLMKLKFSSSGAYQKRIEAQWKWLNSPAKEGDATIRNWWMDDNLQGIWGKLFQLPRYQVVKQAR